MGDPINIFCTSCRSTFALVENSAQPHYCVRCGHELNLPTETDTQEGIPSSSQMSVSTSNVSLISGLTPAQEDIKYSIGPYQIINNIGKGGMGEVFLAYDTSCGRRIALKKIREDLLEHKQLQNRFLKEAHITSQLTHPAIIPIYSIHKEENQIYYTMPFVEGKTLKEIIRNARRNEKKGFKPASSTSIPALMRIFITICNAVAYAHSKGVLHRDLKPENIIIGQYGEVMLLDWGLAKLLRGSRINDEDEAVDETFSFHGLTNAGKVVGTVAYMAPERAFGQPATLQTDIYSLGVILYQFLTLTPPFKRGTLQEFRKNFSKEVLKDPARVAPYRDIPRALSEIAKKCLDVNPLHRYTSIDKLIKDLENFIEGRSEWFLINELDVRHKDGWEFQEYMLISEHVAITYGQDTTDWVTMMISSSSYNGNTRLETYVCMGELGQGIGLMLCIPEIAERQHVNDGFCLWLGSDLNPSTKLLRSTLEVVSRPDIILTRGAWYKVTFEKIDDSIHVYLNDILQFTYISHLPMAGTHIGMFYRDADFQMRKLNVFISSLNITINCLAVPDAFLAHKQYATALSEYRRIAYSFPGRAEGREALFKAGVTLLEKAKTSLDPNESQAIYELALEEFSKQHNTPGAPLEYLGKGLVYQSLKDYEEEMKCYELAFRRYPNHPSLHVLYEQVICRMYEASKYNRKTTYHFILLALRFLPKNELGVSVRKLFNSVEKHWEPLDFVIELTNIAGQELLDNNFSLQVAFWLAKPFVIVEIIDELLTQLEPSSQILSNAFYCLLELGCVDLAQKSLHKTLETLAETEFLEKNEMVFKSIDAAINCHHLPIESFILPAIPQESLNFKRTVLHFFRQAIRQRKVKKVLEIAKMLTTGPRQSHFQLQVDIYKIWSLLYLKEWEEAGSILQSYPVELLSQDTSLLYFLYGCWLASTETKEIVEVHFSGLMDMPFPRSWVLSVYKINRKIDEDSPWIEKAFLWEKRQLFQQLSLFYRCLGDEQKAKHYQSLEAEQYVTDAL